MLHVIMMPKMLANVCKFLRRGILYHIRAPSLSGQAVHVAFAVRKMHKVEQEANDLSACKDSASMYSISTADRHRAALYSDASEQFHLPLSVVLNVVCRN